MLVVLLLALALPVRAESLPGPPPPCADCHVVLVSIDTLRADHLGAYGYPLPTSPRLDALAAESVLFETAITHAPSTTPSHASLFTSTLPWQHGASRGRETPIAPSLRTLAESFASGGWRTVSWNGGGQVDGRFGLSRGFEIYELVKETWTLNERVSPALAYLDSNPGQRAFMFLHSYEVHAPYTPDPELLALFDADYDGSLPSSTTFGVIRELSEKGFPIPPRDLKHIAHTYDAEIRSVDAAIGRLVDGLRERGMLEKTILVVTSDHGDSLGERVRIGEHTSNLHDETLRVPLIIRLPGKALAGTRIRPQVRLIDVMPTLLELTGQEVPRQCMGRSLLPLVAGRESADRVAISQVDSRLPTPPRSVRMPHGKLIVGTGGGADIVPPRRFAVETTLEFEGPYLTLEMAAISGSAPISIHVGEVVTDHVVNTLRQQITIAAVGSGRQKAVIRVHAPCAPAEGDAPPKCPEITLRSLDAYYRLASDPGENHDLLFAAEAAAEIASLRGLLAEALAAIPPAHSAPVKLDPATEELLRSLGYVR